jgi:glycosyltransferase involved in cell wall biosynthesis
METRGHDVLLVVLLPSQPEEWPTTLDVVRLEMRKTPSSLIAGLVRARRFLLAFRPNLIHSHTFPANIVARVLRILFPAVPVLTTVHSAFEGSWLRVMAYWLTDFLSFRTTAVSQAAAARYVRVKAVPAHKISVITNGIDTVEFAPSSARRARLRAKMGVREKFVWLAAGRIVAAKDYPNLLKAFSHVHASAPIVRLWVAGEGASEEVQAQAAELGTAVSWLGLRRDMPALMDAADGFVLASAWEGMPLALGEAMAMEKPVVATDVGGVREMVGDAGVIVPSQSSDALAQSMLTLMWSPPDERSAFGHAARKRIQSHFSMDAKVDEWDALYRDVLAKRI